MKSGIFGMFLFGGIGFVGSFILGMIASTLFPSFGMPQVLGTAIGSSIVPAIIGFFTCLQ